MPLANNLGASEFADVCFIDAVSNGPCPETSNTARPQDTVRMCVYVCVCACVRVCVYVCVLM